MLKCTKFDFRWGSAPDPLAGFKAPTSKGREAKMVGRGRMEGGGKKMRPYYYEKGRRKWIGGREGKRKGFAGPMSKCFLRPCRSPADPATLATNNCSETCVFFAIGVARNWSWEEWTDAQRAENRGPMPRAGGGVLGEGQQDIFGFSPLRDRGRKFAINNISRCSLRQQVALACLSFATVYSSL